MNARTVVLHLVQRAEIAVIAGIGRVRWEKHVLPGCPIWRSRRAAARTATGQ